MRGMRVRTVWAAVPILILAISPVSAEMPTSSPQPRYVQGLWTIMLKSSSHPEPVTEEICLNEEAPPAELMSCAGPVEARSWPGETETVSCTDAAGKHTLSTSVSKDGVSLQDRAEDEPDVRMRTSADQNSWAESVLTYKAKCPVSMQKGSPFLLVKPDATVVDPFQMTGCMVDVLKTVRDVTEPKAGYFRDPHDGLLLFVRYTYPSRHSRDATVITFTGNPVKRHFHTEMSGASPPGEEPDIFGAEEITKRWKDRCGVSVDILFP